MIFFLSDGRGLAKRAQSQSASAMTHSSVDRNETKSKTPQKPVFSPQTVSADAPTAGQLWSASRNVHSSSVYTQDQWQHDLVIYSRNGETGKLTWQSVVHHQGDSLALGAPVIHVVSCRRLPFPYAQTALWPCNARILVYLRWIGKDFGCTDQVTHDTPCM